MRLARRAWRARDAGGAGMALLVAGFAAEVRAQQQAIEEILVTGSRIARDAFTSPAPMSVYSEADFTNSGVVSIDEFLKDTPAFTGFQYGTSTNNGNIGLKAVDLRGLDTKRTLVLINGRRQVGSFIGGNGDVGAVDLNTVPHSLIERVEVLKDGASTIYGSDALGGVVNVILKDDFEGVEFEATYGAGDSGSAANYGFSGVLGTASDRGSVVIALDYSKQEEMLQRQRDWAHFDLHPRFDGARFVATPSGSSNSRRIRTDQFDADATATLVAQGFLRGAQFIIDEASGEVREFGPDDTYNYSPVNALITPNERYQVSAIGTYALTDTVRVFLEGLYTRRFSHQRLAPDASFAITDAYGPGQWNDLVPASNPANPFGDHPRNPWGVAGQDVRLNRRFEESGGRLFAQAVDTYRFVLGLQGDAGSDVSWEFAYNWAQNEDTEDTSFYHRFDRWETLVNPALCAVDTACLAATAGRGHLDPFGPFGTISSAEIDYLMASSLKDVRRNDLQQYSLIFDGELNVELGGGAVGWAAGLEHRRETAHYIPDEFVAGGLTTGGAADPLRGGFSVDEVYAEALLPVTDALQVDISLRDTRYDTSAGEKTTYRVGGLFDASASLSFRGTYSTGFRAPNIVELFGGTQTGFPIIEDPCEFYNRRSDINANIVANCIADGVPEDFEWGFQWQSAYTVEPPDSLEPEESTTWSVGAVWAPVNLPGIQLSADVWNIEVDGLIDEIPYTDLLFICLSAAERRVDPSCAFFSNGLGRDGIFPDDATATMANLGTVSTDGVDFNVDYTRGVNASWAQSIGFDAQLTFVNSYRQDYPIISSRERAGTIRNGQVYPEWKANTALTLQGRRWSATWSTRYISSMDDFLRPPELTDDAVAEPVWYQDVFANLDFWDFVTITVGIDNLTDEDPPRFHSSFNAETEPGYYDVIGRRLFTTFTMRF